MAKANLYNAYRYLQCIKVVIAPYMHYEMYCIVVFKRANKLGEETFDSIGLGLQPQLLTESTVS